MGAWPVSATAGSAVATIASVALPADGLRSAVSGSSAEAAAPSVAGSAARAAPVSAGASCAGSSGRMRSFGEARPRSSDKASRGTGWSGAGSWRGCGAVVGESRSASGPLTERAALAPGSRSELGSARSGCSRAEAAAEVAELVLSEDAELVGGFTTVAPATGCVSARPFRAEADWDPAADGGFAIRTPWAGTSPDRASDPSCPAAA